MKRSNDMKKLACGIVWVFAAMAAADVFAAGTLPKIETRCTFIVFSLIMG